MSGDIEMYSLFQSWLESARPGERFVYYTGNSLTESIVGTVLARKFMEHAFSGDVYLFQKRVSSFVFQHIAIKANTPPIKQLIPIDMRTFNMSVAKVAYIDRNRLTPQRIEYMKGMELHG